MLVSKNAKICITPNTHFKICATPITQGECENWPLVRGRPSVHFSVAYRYYIDSQCNAHEHSINYIDPNPAISTCAVFLQSGYFHIDDSGRW